MSEQKPYFSVIIPVYNRPDQVRRAVESVLQQSYKNYELIIVDDGSTDNTPNVLSEYENKAIVIKTLNKGVSAARNRGLKESKGNYIAFLDSDDEWHQDKLEKQYSYIVENPNIRIFQCDEIWIRNDKRHNPSKKHRKRGGDIFTESLSLCLISPSAVVMHRDIFEEYGLFDELMPVCEDYDLWLRVTLYEKVGYMDDKLLTKYGGHADQLSASTWGMDRYRVYSMIKLYQEFPEIFDCHEKKEKLTNMIDKKCRVIITGAEKRGRLEFASRLSEIIQKVRQNSSCKDYLFLLQE